MRFVKRSFDTLRLRDLPQTQRVQCKSAPRRTIWRLAFRLEAHPQPIPFTKPQNLAISISCSSLSMLAKKWGILQEKRFGTGTVLWVLHVCITQRNTGAQSVQRCGCRSETPAVSVAKGIHNYGTNQLQWLLDNDVEIYAADHAGVTPLHLACLKGHIEVVSLLLNQGCGTETRDNEGDTAMHWASTKVINKQLADSLFSQFAYTPHFSLPDILHQQSSMLCSGSYRGHADVASIWSSSRCLKQG